VRDERALAALSALAVAAALLAMARAEPPSVAGARVPQRPRPHAADASVGEGARALRDGERVELNGANAAELTLLPGIGPTLAARIVAHRDAHGPFGSLQGLVAVRGVGPRTLERIEALVKLGE